MNLIERLMQADPKKDFRLTAIATLTDSSEIRQFYEEYVQQLAMFGESRPKRVAYDGIMELLDNFDRKTVKIWKRALPRDSEIFWGEGYPAALKGVIRGWRGY